ncbi:hypothetical protein [Nonomuraea sp. NPDC049784]|uniref:hypothetical protein n=1 Tax=Nonomuraea sp. NPDC049784 TaxID=3154361 RepID=UPI0033E250B1
MAATLSQGEVYEAEGVAVVARLTGVGVPPPPVPKARSSSVKIAACHIFEAA